MYRPKGGKVTICKQKRDSSLSNEQTAAIPVPNSGGALPQTLFTQRSTHGADSLGLTISLKSMTVQRRRLILGFSLIGGPFVSWERHGSQTRHRRRRLYIQWLAVTGNKTGLVMQVNSAASALIQVERLPWIKMKMRLFSAGSLGSPMTGSHSPVSGTWRTMKARCMHKQQHQAAAVIRRPLWEHQKKGGKRGLPWPHFLLPINQSLLRKAGLRSRPPRERPRRPPKR